MCTHPIEYNATTRRSMQHHIFFARFWIQNIVKYNTWYSTPTIKNVLFWTKIYNNQNIYINPVFLAGMIHLLQDILCIDWCTDNNVNYSLCQYCQQMYAHHNQNADMKFHIYTPYLWLFTYLTIYHFKKYGCRSFKMQVHPMLHCKI